MAQHTITLACVGSCYTDADNRYTNYPSSIVKTGQNPTTMTGTVKRYTGYAKFNDSTLPIRKKVTNITLKYYVSSVNYYNDWARINIGSTDSDVNLSMLTFDATKGYGYSSTKSRTFYNGATIPAFYEDTLNVLAAKVVSFAAESNEHYFEIAGYGSANPPMLTVIYEDVPPDQPTPLAPIGNFISNNTTIKFSWNYNSSVGGTQKSFNLLWSTNGTTWTTVSQTTSNNYHDMPANTLPSGNIYWKVKTYNEYDEASPESDISTFYAIGSPAIPNIVSVTSGTARPTVLWTSSNQQIYQLQILRNSNIVFDTENVASISTKLHKVSEFLEDGDYTAQVRVKNEYDLWSGWGSTNFTITTTKPAKPTLVLVKKSYNITAISNIADNSYLLLYRSEYHKNNYICIKKTANNEIADYAIESNKKYKYFIRCVNSNEAYNDSNILDIYSPAIQNPVMLSVLDCNNVFVVKHNLGDKPNKSITKNLINTTNYFTGRKYSVTEFSEFEYNQIYLTFWVDLEADFLNLNSIINLKNIILYKDSRRKMFAKITGYAAIENVIGYTVNLTIDAVDYKEEVEV
ncbi:hypothetical protein LY28_01351 [Ruminiclostridium sufflavum DSM 19573]|uniref:Fibronectin type-III domain-containing protein n=1 Tax=Ruminiclostridium sufflavum DSM 19573 TaxID=1121337 RepID=A0A318XR64_9FIRM|nr:hypothetical protein [Ruminiclostridium sufflavum]PYG88502.1 hypothetical protein LY28_01351 [Ruminiclostridium sufflavum DSM 19573]